MSLVLMEDAQTLDDNELELVRFDLGGIFKLYADGSALGAQTLTVRARTAVLQGGLEVLHSEAAIVGPTPDDPAVVELGEIITFEPLAITAQLSTATPADVPWRLEQVGRLESIENGQGELTATGAEDTLATVPYGGAFVLLVDVSAMELGDELKLRLKARGAGPDTAIVTHLFAQVDDAPTGKIFTLGPLEVRDTVIATLEQSDGTLRAFRWAIARVA